AIIQDRASTMTRDQQRELLNVIHEETDRLNRFVGGLVAVEQADRSDHVVLQMSSVASAVRGAIARAALLTRDHGIDASVDDSLPRVGIDEPSLVEVLYMLLDNASKYAPPHTSISLSANIDQPGFVALHVSDQGPGIPLEFRERVFERFFRIPHRESYDL